MLTWSVGPGKQIVVNYKHRWFEHVNDLIFHTNISNISWDIAMKKKQSLLMFLFFISTTLYAVQPVYTNTTSKQHSSLVYEASRWPHLRIINFNLSKLDPAQLCFSPSQNDKDFTAKQWLHFLIYYLFIFKSTYTIPCTFRAHSQRYGERFGTEILRAPNSYISTRIRQLQLITTLGRCAKLPQCHAPVRVTNQHTY